MFRIAKMTDYALLVTNELVKTKSKLMTLEAITKKTKFTIPTARKILKLLVDGGIVESFRGVYGGYRLAKKAKDLNLADVILALEGDILITECAGGNATCDYKKHCALKKNWSYINRVMLVMFNNVSLEDMSKSLPFNKFQLKMTKQ